jgi:hypothetical protein
VHHVEVAAERAALRAFQLKPVRVTLLVLLALACWLWAIPWLAEIGLEWLGGGVLAVLALKLVLGGLLGEMGHQLVSRMAGMAPKSCAILRWGYYFGGFESVLSGKLRHAGFGWIDFAAFGVFLFGSVATGLRIRAANRKQQGFEDS